VKGRAMGGRLGKGDGDPYLSYLEMMELAQAKRGQRAAARPRAVESERWVGSEDVMSLAAESAHGVFGWCVSSL
jgi:hypothetical protein